jgi:surface protein
MGIVSGPKNPTDGLELCLDASSKRSFGGAGSTWKDLGKKKRNGTLSNFTGPSLFSSLYGGRFEFKGNTTESEVNLPTIDVSSYTEFSVIQWAKREVPTGRSFSLLKSGSDDIGIHWGKGGNAQVLLGTGNAINFPVNNNEIAQIAMTFDGSTLKCYKNGSLVGSTSASFDFSSVNGALNVGNHAGTDEKYFRGSIFSTMVYSRELTEKDVRDNYLSSRSRFSSPEPNPTNLIIGVSVDSSAAIGLNLPSAGSFDFTIDWGDQSTSTITSHDDLDATHTYTGATAGDTYVLSIDGSMSGWNMKYAEGGTSYQCVSFPFFSCSAVVTPGQGFDLDYIAHWGNLNIDTAEMFHSCTNLESLPSEAPTITTNSLYRTFYYCVNFNSDISSWDVSNVTNMSEMFYGPSAGMVFNKPLNNWNTSNVTNMQRLFAFCKQFNQDLDNWDTSNVTNMQSLFYQCNEFNYDISNWDTSSVTNMQNIFSYCSKFNQNISVWDVSNVTNMNAMFSEANVFNQDLSSWDTSSATNMSSMFYGTDVFNNGGASGIGNWNTANATTMDRMFSNSIFNQPIGNWDTSNVTDFTRMFYDNSSFDQDISSWDFSSAYRAAAAGGLCLFNCVYDNGALENFLQLGGLSTSNYDALLIAWASEAASNTQFRDLINVNMGSSTYTAGSAAATARSTLINSYGFSITDGGST